MLSLIKQLRDMEKLTLKHLAPYLPYGLKGILIDDVNNDVNNVVKDKDHSMIGYIQALNIHTNCVVFTCNHFKDWTSTKNVKPILRPLSDLTVEEVFKFNRISDLPFNRSEPTYSGIKERCIERIKNDDLSFCILDVMILFEWHFDVFGLIDNGLAIDINTLNN